MSMGAGAFMFHKHMSSQGLNVYKCINPYYYQIFQEMVQNLHVFEAQEGRLLEQQQTTYIC